MEAELAVRLITKSEDEANRLKFMLQDETRPILDDEVEPEHRDVFNILDELADVEWASVTNSRILNLWWRIDDRDSMDDTKFILSNLIRAGGLEARSILFFDGMPELYVVIDKRLKLELKPLTSEKLESRLIDLQGDVSYETIFEFIDLID